MKNWRKLLLGLWVGVGLICLGHRPVSSQEDFGPSDLSYVSADADMVLVFRPAKLLADRSVKQLLDDESMERFIEWQDDEARKMAGLPAKAIDQLTMLMIFTDRGPQQVTLYHTLEDIDESELTADLVEVGEVGRKKIYRSRSGRPNEYLVFLDERTLARAYDEEQLKSLVERGKGDPRDANWYVTWRNFEDDAVVYVFNASMGEQMAREFEGSPVSELVQPVLDAEYVIGSATLAGMGDKLKAYVEVGAEDKAHAREIEDIAGELIQLGKIGLAQAPAERMSEAEVELLGMAKEALKSIDVTVEGKRVVATAEVNVDWKAMASTVVSTRAAAIRTQSMNNIRQLCLAMHNYHSVHGHFPPAVIVSENGKRHSWRIELLPYLEQKALYDSYRFDEDWDSPHNAEVTKNMPRLYGTPDSGQDAGTETSYFAVVGDGSVFGGSEGIMLSQIPDGLSNTICLIEGQQKTHWAKPEDIPIDRVKALMGGVVEGGASAAFCDGSVRFLEDSIDADVLRGLLTVAGGEVDR